MSQTIPRMIAPQNSAIPRSSVRPSSRRRSCSSCRRRKTGEGNGRHRQASLLHEPAAPVATQSSLVSNMRRQLAIAAAMPAISSAPAPGIRPAKPAEAWWSRWPRPRRRSRFRRRSRSAGRARPRRPAPRPRRARPRARPRLPGAAVAGLGRVLGRDDRLRKGVEQPLRLAQVDACGVLLHGVGVSIACCSCGFVAPRSRALRGARSMLVASLASRAAPRARRGHPRSVTAARCSATLRAELPADVVAFGDGRFGGTRSALATAASSRLTFEAGLGTCLQVVGQLRRTAGADAGADRDGLLLLGSASAHQLPSFLLFSFV